MAARQALADRAIVIDDVRTMPERPHQLGRLVDFVNNVLDSPGVRPGEVILRIRVLAETIIIDGDVSVGEAAGIVLHLEISRGGVPRNRIGESKLVVLALHAPDEVPGDPADFDHLGGVATGEDDVAVGVVKPKRIDMDVVADILAGQSLIGVRDRDMVQASPLKDHIAVHIQFLDHRLIGNRGWKTAGNEFAHVHHRRGVIDQD